MHGEVEFFLSRFSINIRSTSPVLVVGCKAVHNNRDRKGENEDAREGTASTNDLPKQGFGIEVVAHGGQGH